MTTPGKQTIYVDVDDEITTIIDKMNSTEARVIALVLPKRATVFQSIVNMKLLKRRAESAQKHIVLITSEAGLLPLAGAVGIHVAPTLQSRPEIPPEPSDLDSTDEVEEEAVSLSGDEAQAIKQDMAIGVLAASHAPGVNELADGVVELDNAPKKSANPIVGGQPPRELAAAAAAKPVVGKGQGKKFSVPNFLRFRKWLVFGGLALVLFIVFLVLAFTVMPHATIAIKTDTSDVNADINLTLDTSASSVDAERNVVPAQTQQQQKSYTESVPATGEKNLGNKATGSVTMTAKKCGGNPFDTPSDVPAGTGLSANGLTFITQETASFHGTGQDGSGCYVYSANGDTPIQAQKAGSSYNVNSADFTVTQSGVTATGSTSGGTDRNVKVVQQSDIDSAKQKLSSQDDKDNLKRQLQQNLQNSNLYALTDTFTAQASNVNTSVKVGDEAANVTVSESITYTMYGAKQSDLEKVIDAAVNKQIDTAKQSIQDDGLSRASISVPKAGNGKTLGINIAVTASIGPHLDVDKIKESAVGKKSGELKSLIKANPGVEEVEVNYSPFWVTKAPKASKITVEFQKASKPSDGQ